MSKFDTYYNKVGNNDIEITNEEFIQKAIGAAVDIFGKISTSTDDVLLEKVVHAVIKNEKLLDKILDAIKEKMKNFN
jgi:hypothetical protein